MPDLVAALLLALVFVVCVWSGRTLSHHYQDRSEAVAIFAIGVCVLAGLFLTRGVGDDAGAWPKAALALASSAGLFTGYMRGGAR